MIPFTQKRLQIGAAITVGAAVLVSLTIALAAMVFQAPPNLDTRVAEARAVLERARTKHSVPSRNQGTVLPLPDVDEPEIRKILFIAHMLPLVAEENERILAQRTRVEGTPSLALLNALARDYGIKPSAIPGGVDRRALLKRIDRLPESLVLAQAAIESAWGTSRFARQGYAYFGERTYNPETPGIAPKRATGFKVKSFRSPSQSVRSYMRTLNSHRAYRAMRQRRAELRAQGQAPSGPELAEHLGQYSEIGQDYIDRILITIHANQLNEFDGITHINH